MTRLTIIGGGVRSGKSRYALELARRRGHRRAFVATAEALDSEMQRRIDSHQRERGRDFTTIETPIGLPGLLTEVKAFDVVLVDCLTLWLSNLLLTTPEHMPRP